MTGGDGCRSRTPRIKEPNLPRLGARELAVALPKLVKDPRIGQVAVPHVGVVVPPHGALGKLHLGLVGEEVGHDLTHEAPHQWVGG